MICSRRSLQKSDRERSLLSLFTKEWPWAIALVALYKRATWVNWSRRFLKNSNVRNSLVMGANCLQKTSASLKKIIFFHMFLTVFPLFMPKSELLPSLFTHLLFFKERIERFDPITLYKIVMVSNLLRLFMTKERLRAICSGRSWQKSDGSDSLFFAIELIFHSFAHKKRVNRSQNWRADSQPWKVGDCKTKGFL